MRRRLEAWLALALLALPPVLAQSLPLELERVATRLPVDAREQLQQRQHRLAGLTSTAREALQARVAEWEALPVAERRARRDAWQAWQAIPADEQARMREARARFDALPVEAQRAVRARFDGLDEHLRHGWLLGPTLGLDWQRLHALLAQVPMQERQSLLVALRALSLQGRSDLAVLSQRTAPEERDALRRDLLALPADARDAWLRSRVDPP